MTDKINSLIVTLEKDMREDDAQEIISAVSMIKGVLSVKPNIALPIDEHVAKERLKTDLFLKISHVFFPTTGVKDE